MGEFYTYIKNRRHLVNLFTLVILMLGLPLAAGLARERQILSSRASTDPITFVVTDDRGCIKEQTVNGVKKKVAVCEELSLKLLSPKVEEAKTKSGALITTAFAGHLGNADVDYCEEDANGAPSSRLVHEDSEGNHIFVRDCAEAGEVCQGDGVSEAGRCVAPDSTTSPEESSCRGDWFPGCKPDTFDECNVYVDKCNPDNFIYEDCTANSVTCGYEPPQIGITACWVGMLESNGDKESADSVCQQNHPGSTGCNPNDPGPYEEQDGCQGEESSGGELPDADPEKCVYSEEDKCFEGRCKEGSQSCTAGSFNDDCGYPDYVKEVSCPNSTEKEPEEDNIGSETACWKGSEGAENRQESADSVCQENHPGSLGCARTTGTDDTYDDGCKHPEQKTCRDNPQKPYEDPNNPDAVYKWKALCDTTCSDSLNHSDCPSGANNEKGWCYEFEDESKHCLKLELESSGSACKYDSTQALIVKNNDPWKDNVKIKLGESVKFAGFHDETGNLADDVSLKVEGPSGANVGNLTGNDITFKPNKAGQYKLKVTTKDQSGSACSGNATLIVKGGALAVQSFKISETRVGLDSAREIPYQGDSYKYKLTDLAPGTKTIFVTYNLTNGATDGPHQKQIEFIGGEPVLSDASCEVDSDTVKFTLKGANFGSSQGAVKSGDNTLRIPKDGWKNNSVTAILEPQGGTAIDPDQNFTLSLTKSDGRTASETRSCNPKTTQLAFGGQGICGIRSKSVEENAVVQFKENITGAKVITETATIKDNNIALKNKLPKNADGSGKKFSIWIKPLKSLGQRFEIESDADTKFIDAKFPVGDVDGNGLINSSDYSRMIRNLGKTGTNLPEDLVPDGKVNGPDVSCVISNVGKSSSDPLDTAAAAKVKL